MTVKAITLVAVLSLMSGCNDMGPPQERSLNIQMTLIEGRLWADFRSPVLPEDDNVRCEFRIVIANSSRAIALEGSELSQVEVLRPGTMSSIGVVRLYTTWNGSVAPGVADTVLLIKRTNQGPTLTPVPCDSMVTFRIALMKGGQVVGVVQSDSVMFDCYQ